MIKKTSILTVSVIAVMAVCSARADIASTTYVDTQVQSVDNKLTAHTGNNDIHVTTAEKNTWNAKQGAIDDLGTIRSGAAAGATAVQPSAIANMQTTGNMLVTTNAQDERLTQNAASETMYPSMKTASDLIALSMNDATRDLGVVDGRVTVLENTAVTHTKNTAVGSETVPVYVGTNGKAVAITSYSGTAARATADADGNSISSTYATKGELSQATSDLSTEISGKQAKITSTAKLNSDLVDDTDQTHKFVTATEKTTWSNKQDAITATNKLPAANVSGLANIATSGSYADLTVADGAIPQAKVNGLTTALAGKANTGDINNATLTIQKNGTSVATFTANQGTAATANITVPTQPSDIGAATAAQGAKADAAIPAPTLTQLASDGTLVLTAKQGTGNTVVYAWEEIGR